MISRKRISIAIVFAMVFGILAGGLLEAQDKDVIFRKDTKKSMSVDEVTAETYEDVTYKRGSRESKLTVDKIEKIQYHDTPDAWQNGLRFAKKGDWENAEASFKLAMDDGSVRSWIKTYGLYELGKVYQQWGLSNPAKFKKAIESYTQLLADDPKTRFYAEVLFNLGKSHADSGDMQKALEVFDRLAQDAYDKKLGSNWEARAKFEKAVARMNGGDFDEANRDFRSALTFAGEQLKNAGEDAELISVLKRIEGLSKLYQGTVLIKKKKYKDATRFFEQIINDNDATRNAKAGAECGLGECLLAEGKLKEAQAQFARAKVRYADLPEGGQATYYLGMVCLELKDKEPNYKKRARDYFQEVVKEYADSEWASEAQSKIE